MPEQSTRRRAPVQSRRPAARAREFDLLRGFLDMFQALGNPWQVGASGFEARLPLKAPGIGGRVIYKVHTVGWGDTRLRYHASVTLWHTRVPNRSGSAKGLTPAQAEKRWRAACTRVLREAGYSGRWHRYPWARFGAYWKRLPSLAALRAELRLYDRWSREPPW
jgi:hypothetical protein